MDQYWIDILVLISERLVPLLILVAGILIINWAKKKGATTEQINLLQEAFLYLQRAVISTNQIWVDALKAAEGGLTKEQQEEARKATRLAFEAMLTDSIKLAIETAYGTVGHWLDINLEAAVGEVKNSKIIPEKTNEKS